MTKCLFNKELNSAEGGGLPNDYEPETLAQWLTQAFTFKSVCDSEIVQTLWSGYGAIVRYKLIKNETERDSVLPIIVKWVSPPDQISHPRGWHNPLSHQRKLTSYQVEVHAYRLFNQLREASHWPSNLVLPYCFNSSYQETPYEQVLLLEDLDHAGYPVRKSWLTPEETWPCLEWLAAFHAFFMMDTQSQDSLPSHLQEYITAEKINLLSQQASSVFGLWPIGSYWHLSTRPAEWQAIAEGELKDKAAQIDRALNNLRFQTQIHGDAKLANFCFSHKGEDGLVKVAALDFQYMGQGCGMKDVVYFLGSCLSETQCEQFADVLLDRYFVALRSHLARIGTAFDIDLIETEWRNAFDLAWADFQRFIEGWCPTHKKNTHYSRTITQQALNKC